MIFNSFVAKTLRDDLILTNHLVLYLSMLKRLFIFLLFIPFTVAAQFHISGRVIDLVTKKPVADASVLLTNSSAGTKANNDGTFTINNVREGQYELIISVIGYETYHKTVMVNKDVNLGDVGIFQQSILLNEVRIGPDKHWAEHYAHFKKVFLGTTDNSSECDIINPHVLNFFNDKGNFTANAEGFLEIENKALGYRIKYMLVTFSDNANTNRMYYAGRAFFEDMPGNKRQLKRWKKNRDLTYFGSDMHFYRSIIDNRVKENGFTVRRLIRRPNPDYKGGNDIKYIQTLVTIPLATDEFSTFTNEHGVFALKFKDCLNIIYKDNGLSASILTIDGDYALFDNNGVLLNPESIVMEGNWGQNRMADMLPVDYESSQE